MQVNGSAKSIICGMTAAELISVRSTILGIRMGPSSFAKNTMYGMKGSGAAIDNGQGDSQGVSPLGRRRNYERKNCRA